MQASHRDRRVARDIARSTWGMLGLVVLLSGLAIAAPLEALRFSAVLGLAVAGGVFVWQSGKTVAEYVWDLDQVQFGREVSGRVIAEVSSEVGPDGQERQPSRAFPPVRRDSRRGPPGPSAP